MWLCRVAVNCYCFPVLRIVLAVVLNNARTKFKTMLTQLLHSLNWLSIRLNWTCALISVVKHIWNSYQRCLNESIKYCHKCKIPAQGDTGLNGKLIHQCHCNSFYWEIVISESQWSAKLHLGVNSHFLSTVCGASIFWKDTGKAFRNL